MRRLFPQSLHGFLLTGLALLAIPLLFALLQASVQMRRLTAESQALVVRSVKTAHLSQELYAEAAAWDTKAHLYQVLADETDLAAYRERAAAFSATLTELGAHVSSADVRAELSELVRRQAALGAATDGNPAAASTARGPGAAYRPIADFEELKNHVTLLSALLSKQTDSELAALETRTDKARRQIWWESTLLIPVALIALLALTFGVGRPLRQIDQAIGELGRGNFSHNIAVSGSVDLQKLGQQLEWLRTRLVELAQERNRFLRHMSHELKTPLANIREGSELLLDGAVGTLAAGQREVVGILQENSIKLQRMIENLLSFSAWQSSSVGLDLSEFKLRPLVKQVLENQQLTLVSQRVRLDVNVQDLTLVADRGKLRLILENLVSNAIKYSQRGGSIHVRAQGDGRELVLEVADSGVGIPQADRVNIFEAFYTGRSPGGHIKGTGIGLSVVNEFVNVHQGSIEIVDGEFPGAHFRIRMPQRAAAAPLDSAANSGAPGPAGAGRSRANAA